MSEENQGTINTNQPEIENDQNEVEGETPNQDQSGSTKNIQIPNKKNIQDKESFQRINYLLQAAYLVTAQSPKAVSISTFYSSLIHSIAQKSLIRLHPNVKRFMCRGCKRLLIPGVTAQVTVKSRPYCIVLWTCHLCGTKRRMPAKRGHQLWIEKPEAIVSHNLTNNS